MLEVLFWSMVLLVIYSYALYPVCLIAMSALAQVKRDTAYVLNNRNARGGTIDDTECPQVAVVISAYNEQDCIAQRIRNLQQLDYPSDRIRFMIGSDGSKDNTAEIVSGFKDERIRFFAFEQNRGKASVLNDLVAQSDAEILVFSDANTNFAPDAVKQLSRHFVKDAAVEAVCGELDLVDPQSGENQDGVYWKYERLLKFNEARIGGLLGANGAIYAIRRHAYREIAPDTVVDDFSIVFQISLNGGRVIYDPESRATEEVAPSEQEEYKRRVRIGSGNFQAFHRYPGALNPGKGTLWFCYLSHKVLRWFTPLFLLCALVISAILALDSGVYIGLLLLQMAMYLLCVLARHKRFRFGPLKLLLFWLNMNLALGHGALRYYFGNVTGTWGSTSR